MLTVGAAPAPPDVAITGGPSGTVSEPRGTFEFAALDPPPGRFECQLDGGSFTPCASPVTVGPLADGEHVFAVRYKPDGAEAGRVTERNARGRVAFTPSPIGPRQRTIELNVSRKGLPRGQRIVARYRAPAPAKLRAPAGIRRKGTTLRWTAEPGAAGYSVAVQQGATVVLVKSVSRASVTLPAVARRGAITVIVVPLALDGKPGPAARVTLTSRSRPRSPGWTSRR